LGSANNDNESKSREIAFEDVPVGNHTITLKYKRIAIGTGALVNPTMIIEYY
jgi:hypothetical protein